MALRYPMAMGLNKDQKVNKNMSKLRHNCQNKHFTNTPTW